MIRYSMILLACVTASLIGGCTQSKTVLVTGYWPPTNEMLVPFSTDEILNPGGWQGKNWQGTGYDVVAYFPTFPQGTDVNPAGEGNFQVDYQATWADFGRVTKKLRPAAIISYGRGAGPWEIEANAMHLEVWRNDYRPPEQPGCFCGFSKTYQDGEKVRLTLPVEAIQAAVDQAVPQLRPWVDTEGDPGDFLCNYIAFLAADYQIRHAHCKVSGFIHVGPTVDLQTAEKAHIVTLQTVIAEINN